MSAKKTKTPQSKAADLAIPSDATKPLSLTKTREILLSYFTRKHRESGTMYLGALTVFNARNNPDYLAFAAHGFRELMEKLPEYFDAPLEALSQPGTKAKAQELSDGWQSCTAKSECHENGAWGGEIDAPLRKGLKRVDGFVEWFRTYHPKRREEIKGVLQKMDPSGRRVPGPIEDLNISEWTEIRDFFVKVAHHRCAPTNEEFESWVQAFEHFLVTRLQPPTSRSRKSIQRILKEAKESG